MARLTTFEEYLKMNGTTIEEYQAMDNDTRLGWLRGHSQYNLFEIKSVILCILAITTTGFQLLAAIIKP